MNKQVHVRVAKRLVRFTIKHALRLDKKQVQKLLVKIDIHHESAYDQCETGLEMQEAHREIYEITEDDIAENNATNEDMIKSLTQKAFGKITFSLKKL